MIGVYTELTYEFPLGEVYRRGITLAMGGLTNVQAHWTDVLERVKDGRMDPTIIISHTLPLEEAVHGYDLFDRREAMKVVLKP